MPDSSVEDRTTIIPFKTALAIVVVVGAFLYLIWAQRGLLGPMTPLRYVGMALAAVGLIGWVTARLQLGQSFSIRPKATELVTHGIYSKIRNPVYVSGTVLLAGLILWAGRPIWLVVLLILIPVQVIRARREAQVLEAKFGDGYRTYRARTWF